MSGNFDVSILIVGFLVGAAPIAMLGRSLLEDHERRLVIPATIVSALCCGAVVSWALDAFVHFAQRSAP